MPSRKGKKGRKKKQANKRSTASQSDVSAALLSEISVPPPYSNLRFVPGDIVLAHCNYWKRGKIKRCNVVDRECTVPRRLAYIVSCESGGEVGVPEDRDFFVRLFSKEVLLTLAGRAPEPLLLEHEFPASMVMMHAGVESGVITSQVCLWSLM